MWQDSVTIMNRHMITYITWITRHNHECITSSYMEIGIIIKHTYIDI
jgi:hypothetical protein